MMEAMSNLVSVAVVMQQYYARPTAEYIVSSDFCLKTPRFGGVSGMFPATVYFTC